MASSDASTSLGSEYQVFLSFRGPDTRVGFTDFLFHSLTDAGISVFRDDEELRVGERIDGSLQRAINNSRIYIPIFSPTYASSQWCLRELAQIMANTSKSEGQKMILPIFFDVEPDDVKLKTPLYRDAIFNLEREKKLNNGQVDAWREALMEVNAIKGWEVKKYKGYGDVIKLVVEEVVRKLKTKHRLVTEHLVGIDDRVATITELLDIDSNDVRLIGIHGMGGIGKTTLAKIVFNQLLSHYGKCCCFLEDVGVKSLRTDSLVELQKKLSSEIGHLAGTRSIDEIDYGTKRTGEILSNKKVLIVLDDVANSDQVLKLVGGSTLYPGSRILITTRNKDALRINKPNYQILEYEMEVMSCDHALELFSRHAFNKDSPSSDYNDLSMKIVFSTGRLPLALEVIGSFLFDKRQQIWKETLKKLSKAPHKDVFGKLKISYDALSYEEQQIFLDIACFFIGRHTTYAIYMWKDCDFFPDAGVDALISMSLVKIVENKFWMHDQLRDLGREIVHRENPINPGERSRIWINKEVLDAIRTTEMKKNVQALTLNLHESESKTITSEEIGRFPHLRYLRLNMGTFSGNLAKSLTNLSWIDLPRQLFFKPTNMPLKNVVLLEFLCIDFIDNSNLHSIIKMAGKLKVLSLFAFKSIDKMLDFSGFPNLERLNFKQCYNLNELDGSIGKLKSLIDLKISSCSLRKLPEEIGNLVNLKHFLIEGCPVKKLPNSIVKLKSLISLKIRHCHSLENLPEEIENLVNLKHFSIEEGRVKKLPDSIWKLKSLCELHFKGVIYGNSSEIPSTVMLENLEVLQIHFLKLKGRFPSTIERSPFLRILSLSRTHISEVPETISMLPCLQTLKLLNCDEIQELPTLPTSLNNLQVSSKSLQIVPDLSNLTNLILLDLSDGSHRRQGGKICAGDLGGFGKLSKLRKLRLELLNVPAPSELASLSQLKELHLFGLDLRTLMQLPSSLLKLTLHNVNSTMSLSSRLENLSRLELSSFQVQEIQLSGLQLQNLTELILGGGACDTLERLGLSNLRKLKTVKVARCPKLVEIQFVGVFESLDEFSISQCQSWSKVQEIQLSKLQFPNLTKLDLFGITPLETLRLSNLRKLKTFRIENCPELVEIQFVGVFESLDEFSINHRLSCSKVQEIKLSELQLPNLTKFVLCGSAPLETLRLSNLRKLKTVIVKDCPKLVEIQFAGVFESLESFSIEQCRSLGRFGYVGEAECADELIIEEGRLILLSRVLCKLRTFSLTYCHKILQIQVVCTSELWKGILGMELSFFTKSSGFIKLKEA